MIEHEHDLPLVKPPDWTDAVDCNWEAIGHLICEPGIPEETYRAAIGLALHMAADPLWQRAVGVVAAALERVSFLDAADVSMLLAA